jgi:hypothetical protein
LYLSNRLPPLLMLPVKISSPCLPPLLYV